MRRRFRRVVLAAAAAAVSVVAVVAGVVVTGAAPAAAGTCTARSETHADPNTGQSWDTAWYCGNDSNAPLYLDAGPATVVGWMDSTTSWFVCYRHGAQHSGGNDVWYYTQGDRAAPGWEDRQAWGYMPAATVATSVDPYPGIPECRDGDARPTPSKPPTDRSYYVTRIDNRQAYDLGCTQGESDTSRGNRSSSAVLAFGGQRDDGSGTQLTFSGTQVTNGQIESYAEQFAEGYYTCARRGGNSQSVLSLGIGTNNDIDSAVTEANGRRWACLVNRVSAWVAARGDMRRQVQVGGANDMEPGFGPVVATRAWVQGFTAATQRTLLNFGSADGCPVSLSTDTTVNHACNNGWSIEDIWWVSGGAERVVAAPEIYNTAQPQQWAVVSRYGADVHHHPLAYHAVWDHHAMGDGTNTAQRAWDLLWRSLRLDQRTAIVPAYSMEICRTDFVIADRCSWS